MIQKRITDNRQIFIWLLPLLFPMLNLLFMHYYIYFHHYMEDALLAYAFGVNLMVVLFDVFSIFLVFVVLSVGRLKISLLLTFITTLLWSFVNVFYVRFFGQYLPLSILSQTTQLTDQAVVNSMIAGFQWTDMYYVLSLVFFVMLYIKIPVVELKRPVIFRLLLIPVFSFVGIFVIYSFYHALKKETRGNSLLYEKRIKELLYGDARNAYPNCTRFLIGSVRVIGGEIYDMLNEIELTPNQRDLIVKESEDMSQRFSNHIINPNIKNVVFVVLESFLSSPIDLKVDNKEITPYLNSLKKERDVYYNGYVMPNITMGESGDGQFIFMTGILPLRDKLTVGEAKNQTLPSFPRLLKEYMGTNYTEIVTPSPPQVWEQRHMNEVYGIQKMYCNYDVLGYSVNYLNDEQVFSLAMKSPCYQRQSFFTMILSYSTHQPYRSPVDDSFHLKDNTLSDAYKNYLIACHYTDKQLKKYIDFLKNKGVYNNSLIVITADHHAHLDALGMDGQVKKDLPLFIINGNIDTSKSWNGEMNQLDIFTTLLDVLGLKCKWHGLGHSILFSNYRNSVTDHVWDISEQIIKGKFFQTNQVIDN